MGQSREKIVRRLETARADQAPVTVRREHLDEDETAGFVVAVLDEWVVLHDIIGGVHLDDVVLLRLSEVTKVERFDELEDAYVRRAVTALGVPVAELRCPPDATVADLLALVDERAELVGVHLEDSEGDWINFGKIRSIGRKRLDLQFVGRDGDWVDVVDAWRMEEITRIEFGGRYITALERFSDPMPEVVSRRKR